ncbi:uncharacterized protein LOC108907203 [Anoplophora glabripennis]|uniref:uncharacterized protein LOC108907203 n=1 Tax=Anoplophora glabripennis TaxID=217634 RepID=UPI000C769FE5|nr:uncharacterized protein LOC108907203 [Anoplophora glabripennis]
MSRATLEELTGIIGNAVVGLHVYHKIPLEKKILFTIWVISKAESFLAAGDRFGIARSTAHNIFREIIEVLHHLRAHYIRWPVDYDTIQEAFYARSRIPGIVGAIDGCHVEIKQPMENANDYYNRNNYHSIILQDFGSQIISAACVLHNFIIMHDSEDNEEFQADPGIINEYDGNEPDANRNLAVEKRAQISEHLLL